MSHDFASFEIFGTFLNKPLGAVVLLGLTIFGVTKVDIMFEMKSVEGKRMQKRQMIYISFVFRMNHFSHSFLFFLNIMNKYILEFHIEIY